MATTVATRQFGFAGRSGAALDGGGASGRGLTGCAGAALGGIGGCGVAWGSGWRFGRRCRAWFVLFRQRGFQVLLEYRNRLQPLFRFRQRPEQGVQCRWEIGRNGGPV
ncbi:MAG: hypothetical protein R3F44_10245 [Candidatus Competibacteraceae bacterium]